MGTAHGRERQPKARLRGRGRNPAQHALGILNGVQTWAASEPAPKPPSSSTGRTQTRGGNQHKIFKLHLLEDLRTPANQQAEPALGFLSVLCVSPLQIAQVNRFKCCEEEGGELRTESVLNTATSTLHPPQAVLPAPASPNTHLQECRLKNHHKSPLFLPTKDRLSH